MSEIPTHRALRRSLLLAGAAAMDAHFTQAPLAENAPVRMALAMKLAIEAGRHAFLAGRIPRRRNASASSPLDGLLG